jgi:hypothetical protein
VGKATSDLWCKKFFDDIAELGSGEKSIAASNAMNLKRPA